MFLFGPKGALYTNGTFSRKCTGGEGGEFKEDTGRRVAAEKTSRSFTDPRLHCNAVYKRDSGVIMAQTGPFAVLSSLFLLAVEYAPCASLNR